MSFVCPVHCSAAREGNCHDKIRELTLFSLSTVCHNRRLMFSVASLIVMVIFAVAIAKGVAFFRRKRDEGGDSSHKSPEIQSHS